MDIKLIALDLDGTLLDSQKHLSTGNRKALEACCERGIQIVPTTGRTVDGIPDMIKEIPGIRYAITTEWSCYRGHGRAETSGRKAASMGTGA